MDCASKNLGKEVLGLLGAIDNRTLHQLFLGNAKNQRQLPGLKVSPKPTVDTGPRHLLFPNEAGNGPSNTTRTHSDRNKLTVSGQFESDPNGCNLNKKSFSGLDRQ